LGDGLTPYGGLQRIASRRAPSRRLGRAARLFGGGIILRPEVALGRTRKQSIHHLGRVFVPGPKLHSSTGEIGAAPCQAASGSVMPLPRRERDGSLKICASALQIFRSSLSRNPRADRHSERSEESLFGAALVQGARNISGGKAPGILHLCVSLP
jgi:hypothetical protein